jgi:hypothetical protein
MPRESRAAPRDVVPSYPAWKAAAVKALQKLHERAARVTRDGFWTRCYVRNLSPEKAAELAAREYDSTHPAAWVRGGGEPRRLRPDQGVGVRPDPQPPVVDTVGFPRFCPPAT